MRIDLWKGALVAGTLVWMTISPSVTLAYLDARDKPSWSSRAEMDGQVFFIEGASVSGEVDQDDMKVWIRQGQRKTEIPIKEGYYHLADITREVDLTPELARLTIPCVKIDRTVALIILCRDERPGYDQTTLVAYDFRAGKILDVQQSIGALKAYQWPEYLLLQKTPNSYLTRLVREYRGKSDSAATAIEDWMLIQYQNGKLKYGWSKP